jgi:LuxR family maltose regulon positive regulatory protein
VQQSSIPTVWVSLDTQDNDLKQFWSYVIAAIAKGNSNFAEAMNPYVSMLTIGNYVPFITAMIHEFCDHSKEWVLILDDYHMIHLSSIHASIALLLEHMPANVHLYMASRVEPPFPTARLQSISQMTKITVQHLRFELVEGIRYFRDCMGFALSEDDISILVHRTEGWISGLHLAAISLRRSDSYPEFIQAFSGEHNSISDYLFQEVLSHQSEEIRIFLLETSILDRMNNGLCDAITS